ncbi:hypothetical protein ASE40_08735 [Flavobacterium sp. Root935]|nr:hypothetical protein ASE40_08735 [Flavobacterium sp. Root935]
MATLFLTLIFDIGIGIDKFSDLTSKCQFSVHNSQFTINNYFSFCEKTKICVAKNKFSNVDLK